MATKSFKLRYHEENAHCRNCGWHEFGQSLAAKARRHVEKEGHEVEVYRENGTVIKKAK